MELHVSKFTRNEMAATYFLAGAAVALIIAVAITYMRG
jgi:hypothetical protein